MMTNRWIPLVALGIVMLFSASEGNNIGLPCCENGVSEAKEKVVKCLEQEKRDDCDHHFYMIKTEDLKWQCITPESEWLKGLKNQMDCPGVLEHPKFRFEFLDEDDEDFEE